MTVSYQYEVASSTSGGFTRLLFMWKGSLYKLIYRELLLFLLAFGILSALYRHLFTPDQKRLFEKVVVYCDTFINLIPLSFVLGFYVAYVAARWWNQYLAIPWPDKIMHSVALYVTGTDDHARMTRRTLMRYLNLTLILVLRSISSAVKRRFPRLDHLVEAGFMTPTELELFQSVPSVEFNTYWIPCTWFITLLKETRRSNRIADPQGLKLIMEEFNEYRSQCGMLWSYDWVSIPLVYTQVVTIATYSFFLAALVGRQYVDEDRKSFQMEIDIYLPVFTILQFFFYMGLLKVAEQLINPFGDDDEDFELNWLIDRHTKVSYLGADILMTRSPPLVRDMYYNEVDLTLPYTEAAVAYKRKTYRGSVHNMVVPEEQHTMFLPEIQEEEEVDTPRASAHSLHHSAPSPGTGTGSSAPAAEPIWRVRKNETAAGPGAAGGGAGGRRAGRSPRAPTASAQGAAPGPASPCPVEPESSPVLVRRNSVSRADSFHSWKSFFSSLARRDAHSSTSSVANSEGSAGCSSSSSSPSPQPGAAPPTPRQRLQSFPRLPGLSGGRYKKGVRWKPVTDPRPRASSNDDSASLCRGCRERLMLSAPDLRPPEPSRPGVASAGPAGPGSEPNLSRPVYASSRGILKKIKFWGAEPPDGSHVAADSVVVQVDPGPTTVVTSVSRSLPDIATHRVQPGLPTPPPAAPSPPPHTLRAHTPPRTPTPAPPDTRPAHSPPHTPTPAHTDARPAHSPPRTPTPARAHKVPGRAPPPPPPPPVPATPSSHVPAVSQAEPATFSSGDGRRLCDSTMKSTDGTKDEKL